MALDFEYYATKNLPHEPPLQKIPGPPWHITITSIIYSKNKIFTWLSKLGTSSLSLVDTKLGNQSCNIARIGSLSFSSNFSLIRSALISSRLALQHLSLEGLGW